MEANHSDSIKKCMYCIENKISDKDFDAHVVKKLIVYFLYRHSIRSVV
jgi:hypothetical protein